MTEDQFARFVEYAEGRFQQVATKEDLLQLATKDDLARAEARLEERLASEVNSLKLEMRERFEIVHDRLVALEKGHGQLNAGLASLRAEVNELRAQLHEHTAHLGARLDNVEVQVRETNAKLIDLRAEIQQRFRNVTERLAALEHRIAAA
jgi:dynactin complex subunit